MIATEQNEPNQDDAGFFLEFKNLPEKPYQIFAKIALISKFLNEHEKQFQVYSYVRNGLEDFITKDELFGEVNGYLVNDTLTLRVEVNYRFL